MPERFKIMLAVCIGLIVIAIGVAAWSAYEATTSGSGVSEIRQLLNGQQAAAARDDCRARIESRFAHVVQQRDAIGWSAIPKIIGLHVGDTSDLTTTGMALEKANAAVLALPAIEDAVDHGYTLDGKHYPPCPTVKH